MSSQPYFGSKEHRATLLALVSLRPNDSVTFHVFKYGIQAILLGKGEKNGDLCRMNDNYSTVGLDVKVFRQ